MKSKKKGRREFILAVLEKINSRRKGRDITLSEMARVAGYNDSEVRKMATNRRDIPGWTIALWRRRWKLHISREEMLELMEQHLIETEKET